MKRAFGPILLAILIIGAGAGIHRSASEQFTLLQAVTARSLIGSEKEEFQKSSLVV